MAQALRQRASAGELMRAVAMTANLSSDPARTVGECIDHVCSRTECWSIGRALYPRGAADGTTSLRLR
jgi:hypothetical protein